MGITLEPEAVPGEVKPLSGNWVTLVRSRDGTPFAIARSYAEEQQGRVIAIGHDGLLFYRDQNKDNLMLGTALQWLRGDRPEMVVLSGGPARYSRTRSGTPSPR